MEKRHGFQKFPSNKAMLAKFPNYKKDTRRNSQKQTGVFDFHQI